MPAKVGYLVIDAAEPERLAPFWCGLLATGVDMTIGDGEFLRVPEAKAGKNRLHLDLVVDDLDEATAEIEKLGGRWLEPGNIRELEGFRWRCMADPEGNEFDIDVLPPG
jgi:predicted enzyme related to lactoylglutathione lyase